MEPGERFEAAAAEWQQRGRPDGSLAEGYALMVMQCWSWSAGGKRDGVSPTLQSYLKASNAAQPHDWLDALLDDHGSCRQCGTSYRLENLMLCTDCYQTRCHRCGASAQLAANGNPACGCGGELVG